MDDALKQQVMITFVTFNIVFMLYQFLFNWTSEFTFGGVFMGLIVASAAAAGAWFGYAKLK